MADQHLIYHWKHGWIPLTHAAALSKAHGNAHAADRYVPGTSTHHGSRPTKGLSARNIHGGLETHNHQPTPSREVEKLHNGDAATVRGMDQFGQSINFTGRVQGQPTAVRIKKGPNGAVEHHFAVSMHNGSDSSGGDASARTTVYVKRSDVSPESTATVGAAREQAQQAQTARLRASAIAHGDAKPQPTAAELSGAAAAWKSVHPGKPVAGNEAEIRRIADRIAERRYVDTGRTGAAPADEASERARIVGSMRHDEVAKSETVARLAAEARGGSKPTPRKSLREFMGDTPEQRAAASARDRAEVLRRGRAVRDQAAKAEADKPRIEHSGDGTLMHNTSRSDTATNDALKGAGFKWSRNLDAWYLPRNWSEATRRQKVEQVRTALGDKVHIDDKGYAASTTAAEREAETRARATERAGRMDAKSHRLATEADVRFGRAKAIGDMIPFGQPILVGHHSERRHRNDLAKIDTNMRKGVEAHTASQAAAHSADNARRTAAGDSPLARQRRIDRNEADIRKLDRMLAEHETAGKLMAAEKFKTTHPAVRATVERMRMAPDDHARFTTRRADLADQVAHDKAQIEASGHKTVTAADIQPGDVVHYRGTPHVVAKVNQKTVSTPTGYSWDDKIPVNQIQRHTKLSAISDASLEAAVQREKDPRIRAAFIRELNRRGIKVRDL